MGDETCFKSRTHPESIFGIFAGSAAFKGVSIGHIASAPSVLFALLGGTIASLYGITAGRFRKCALVVTERKVTMRNARYFWFWPFVSETIIQRDRLCHVRLEESTLANNDLPLAFYDRPNWHGFSPALEIYPQRRIITKWLQKELKKVIGLAKTDIEKGTER